MGCGGSSIQVFQDGSFHAQAPTGLCCVSVFFSVIYMCIGWSAYNIAIMGYTGAIVGLSGSALAWSLLSSSRVSPGSFKQLSDCRGLLIAAPCFSFVAAITHAYTASTISIFEVALSLNLIFFGIDLELIFYLNIAAAVVSTISAIINIVLAIEVGGIISEATNQGLPIPDCCGCCGGGPPRQPRQPRHMMAQPVQGGYVEAQKV